MLTVDAAKIYKVWWTHGTFTIDYRTVSENHAKSLTNIPWSSEGTPTAFEYD